MTTIMPFGDRVFVTELEPETDIAKRAEKAGLHVVLHDSNVPKPTTGRVIAVGTDPFIQEHVKVGDIVTFSRHAGLEQWVEGTKFRSLESREIIAVIRQEAPVPNPQATVTGQVAPEQTPGPVPQPAPGSKCSTTPDLPSAGKEA